MGRRILYILFLLTLFSSLAMADEESFSKISREIREGKYSIGSKYTMSIDGRFHKIHTELVGLQCSGCHMSGYPDGYNYIRMYKTPVRGAPGVVERSICIGCHRADSIATEWYGRWQR